MLMLENVTFSQGNFALRADVTIPDTSVTAVIGPSGSGKSTLLHGMAGFVEQTAGRLLWKGKDLSAETPATRPIAMLFQDNNLFPHLSVMQNVALALSPRLRVRPSDREQVEGMLTAVGLSGFSDRKPSALSGGQQSRVALARALLQDQPILLMDEPFSALGPGLKAEMLDLSVQLAHGRTVLMVTHDPDDAERVADHVIGVADGQVFTPMTTREFLDMPPPELASYFTK